MLSPLKCFCTCCRCRGDQCFLGCLHSGMTNKSVHTEWIVFADIFGMYMRTPIVVNNTAFSPVTTLHHYHHQNQRRARSGRQWNFRIDTSETSLKAVCWRYIFAKFHGIVVQQMQVTTSISNEYKHKIVYVLISKAIDALCIHKGFTGIKLKVKIFSIKGSKSFEFSLQPHSAAATSSVYELANSPTHPTSYAISVVYYLVVCQFVYLFLQSRIKSNYKLYFQNELFWFPGGLNVIMCFSRL